MKPNEGRLKSRKLRFHVCVFVQERQASLETIYMKLQKRKCTCACFYGSPALNLDTKWGGRNTKDSRKKKEEEEDEKNRSVMPSLCVCICVGLIFFLSFWSWEWDRPQQENKVRDWKKKRQKGESEWRRGRVTGQEGVRSQSRCTLFQLQYPVFRVCECSLCASRWLHMYKWAFAGDFGRRVLCPLNYALLKPPLSFTLCF